MHFKKFTTRSVLGMIALSLVVSSGFALFLFTQSLPTLTISNPSGLTSLCAQPLIAGTTVNNGTSGGHESFTTAYSCTSPITSVTLQLSAQSVQGGASFCNTNVPLFTLTSGTGQALATNYSCQNGSSPATTNTMWYIVTVVASTFGTVNVASVTITWKSS